MNYSYPEKLEIGGLTYRVQLFDSYVLERVGETAGYHLNENGELQVATRTKEGGYRPINLINEIAWHEVLHAISHEYGAGLKECQVEQVAKGLNQVCKQLGFDIVKEE
jgi:hypothetical protein